MGMALATSLPPSEAELEDLYEIVDGQKVWPRVGEPEMDTLYEIVNGQRREIPRMGALAAVLASILAQYLNAFAFQHRLGLAMVEVLFELKPGHPTRRPDVAFVRYDRWPLTTLPTNDPPAWSVVPNFTVEVVSSNNIAEDIEKNLLDYFAFGVELVWVVYPVFRRIYNYESPTQVRILTENDELDGGKVLPGFRLKIGDLFAALVKPN